MRSAARRRLLASSKPTATRIMEAPRPSTSNWVTVSFAIFAAFCGMSSCYAAASAVPGTGGLFIAFFIGGIVTAIVFWVLMRTSPAPEDVRGGSSKLSTPGARRRSRAESPSDPRTAAVVVFLIMAILFTITGALMAGASTGTHDGHPPKTPREALDVWMSGAWKGALIGLVLSLPLSGSASGIAWILRRRSHAARQ